MSSSFHAEPPSILRAAGMPWHRLAVLFLFLAVAWLAGNLRAEVVTGRYDMAAIRDGPTLETRVIEDWHPWGKATGIRQKFIEVTVCEWWPGQRVRLPVTLLAPEKGGPRKNVIVNNAGVPFPDKAEPQKNELWWSVNRHPDYTFAMEYDEWKSVPMRRTGPAKFEAEISPLAKTDTLDFVSVHQHTAAGSTLTLSIPLLHSKPE